MRTRAGRERGEGEIPGLGRDWGRGYASRAWGRGEATGVRNVGRGVAVGALDPGTGERGRGRDRGWGAEPGLEVGAESRG